MRSPCKSRVGLRLTCAAAFDDLLLVPHRLAALAAARLPPPASISSRSLQAGPSPLLRNHLSQRQTNQNQSSRRPRRSLRAASADVRALSAPRNSRSHRAANRAVIRARASFTPLDADDCQNHLSLRAEPDRSRTPSIRRIFDLSRRPPRPDHRPRRPLAGPAGSLATVGGAIRWPPQSFRRAASSPRKNGNQKSPRSSASPIAGLTWLRESTYVRNEPCRPLRIDRQGDFVESDRAARHLRRHPYHRALKQQSHRKTRLPKISASASFAPPAPRAATTKPSSTSR